MATIEPVRPASGISGYVYDSMDVWYRITDLIWCEIPFRVSEIIGNVPSIAHLATGSQRDIIRDVLQSVEAEGNDQCHKISPWYWILPVASKDSDD